MPGPHRSGRILVTLVTLAGGLVLAATAAPAAAQPAGAVRLELVDQRLAFAADGDIRLTYRLTGDLAAIDVTAPPSTTTTVAEPPATPPDDELPPPTELSVVVVNYEPLSSGDDPRRYVGAEPRTAVFSDAIDGVVLPNARELLTFADDGTATLDLAVGTDRGESVEDRIEFDEPGLYPVVASLFAGSFTDGEVLASYGTVVQRLPGPGDRVRTIPPLDLAIVVATDEIGPEPTDAEIARSRTALESALALTSAIDSPVTLSFPPIVLAGAAEDGPDALAEALADDRLLSVPATPLDVSSAAAAGITDAFARRLREGEDLMTAAVPTVVARRDVWIATEPLSAAGAQVVRDLGFRYVVMTPALYAASVDDDVPATDLFVDLALPDGGALPLLVVDALGGELTSDATDDVLEDRTPLEWALATVGRLVLEQQDAGGPDDRSRIVATPDLSAPDPRLIVALERLVATTPGVRMSEAGVLPGVTDRQVVGGDDRSVRLPDDAGPDLTERLARLDATALAMLSAGSMLAEDDPRPLAWSARISELVSTGYGTAEVTAETDALLAEADRLKRSVVPPEPFTFTLTGRSGDIDLRLSNTADEPLVVLVRLSSPKLSFPEGEQLVELRPNEQTMIAVPVRARTNGTSAVEVEVLTPAGEQIHEPVVLTSRVNALTGFGQVVTGGLVLVLLTWWFSHWRARRRETTAAEADAVVSRHPGNPK